MKAKVKQLANALYSILASQGEQAKQDAIEMTLNDFEKTTTAEMQRDFNNNDFSDMDDLSDNLKVYQELKEQLLNPELIDIDDFKKSEEKILLVYDYYEKKYVRELEYRNEEQRKNYIESILSPLMLISVYFNEKSKN